MHVSLSTGYLCEWAGGGGGSQRTEQQQRQNEPHHDVLSSLWMSVRCSLRINPVLWWRVEWRHSCFTWRPLPTSAAQWAKHWAWRVKDKAHAYWDEKYTVFSATGRCLTSTYATPMFWGLHFNPCHNICHFCWKWAKGCRLNFLFMDHFTSLESAVAMVSWFLATCPVGGWQASLQHLFINILQWASFYQATVLFGNYSTMA